AVQRVQHRALGVLDASRRRRHGDHQAHAEGESQRDEDGLAHAAAQFTPQISEEHPAPLLGRWPPRRWRRGDSPRERTPRRFRSLTLLPERVLSGTCGNSPGRRTFARLWRLRAARLQGIRRGRLCEVRRGRWHRGTSAGGGADRGAANGGAGRATEAGVTSIPPNRGSSWVQPVNESGALLNLLSRAPLSLNRGWGRGGRWVWWLGAKGRGARKRARRLAEESERGFPSPGAKGTRVSGP